MSMKIDKCPRCGKRLNQGDQMCFYCGYIIPDVRKMNASALCANDKNDAAQIQSIPQTPRYQPEPVRETVPYVSTPEPGTIPQPPGSTMHRGYSSGGFAMPTCQGCGQQKPTKHVVFYQNIGAIIMRFHKSVDANLCKSCINQYFWEYTMITLALGWWGVISFFFTLYTLPNNIFYYLTTLGLKNQ